MSEVDQVRESPQLSILWSDWAILVGAATLGWRGSLVMLESASRSPEMPPPWPAGATVFDLVLLAVVLGCNFAGPMLLVSHWIRRRRLVRPTWGELLWLCPAALWAAICLTSELEQLVFGQATPFPFVMLSFGVLTCGVAAVLLARFRLFSGHFKALFTWTDWFGCASCVLTAGVFFYSLAVDPL